jgi:hypothetical protein
LPRSVAANFIGAENSTTARAIASGLLSSPAAMSVGARLFLFLTLAFLAVTSREPPWADAHVVYDTTQGLVDHATLDVHLESGPTWFYAHRDGRKYGVFPLGNVFAMVPSYVSFKLARWVMPSLSEHPLFALTVHLSPALMMAAACVIFFHLLRRRGAAVRSAVALTLVLAFGTFVFIYARSPYSEALQTLVLMWVVERTLAQAEAPTTAGLAWLGVACGVMVNAKLVNVLLLPSVAIYLLAERRRAGELGALLRMTPLALLAFGELMYIALWHNHLKTGSIWLSGYNIPNGVFSGDLVSALYGFWLSPGKSLLLYSPPVVLGLCGLPTALERRRRETLFLVSIIALVVAFNAKFRHWHADYCWGPRHLVAITPLLLLLAHPWLPEAMARGRRWLRRAALGALLAVSVGVQLLGAVFYWDHYIRVLINVKDQTGAMGWFTENLSHGHYMPVFSPLRGHWWMLRHLVSDDPDLDRDAPWKPVLPQPTNLTDTWGRMRVDWWLLNYIDATPDRAPLQGLALLALLGGGTLVAGVSLRRSVSASR